MTSVAFDPTFNHSTLFGLIENDETVAMSVPSTRKVAKGKNKEIVEELTFEGIRASPHSFKLGLVEQVGSTGTKSAEFKQRARFTFRDPNLRFLFHGTNRNNHNSIFENGFLIDTEHWGDTDKGYIGKGVYASPMPEYCAAYIKKTSGITRFQYANPVALGTKFSLLGCVTVVGKTKFCSEKEYGQEMDEGHDSHTAWVTRNGDPTGDSSDRFAKEYAMRKVGSLYPRFIISLTRVNKETIWLDPNMANGENSGIRRDLQQLSGFGLYATGDGAKALAMLKRKKEGTAYRVVTAGKGGEEFVKSARDAGITTPVIVFCMNTKYHQTWAKKFPNVTVTDVTSAMKTFASWGN